MVCGNNRRRGVRRLHQGRRCAHNSYEQFIIEERVPDVGENDMRTVFATRVVVMAAVAMLSSVFEPLPGMAVGADAAKTDWLSQARWGVMTHYLARRRVPPVVPN